MTIIQPAKNKHRMMPIIMTLIGIFIVAGFYICEYNRSVAFSHQIDSLKKEIIKQKDLNSDIKSQIYQLANKIKFEELAAENNLILEQKPSYLSSN